METGFLTAIPGLVGALAMILWTRHSDVTGERKWHMIIPSVLGGEYKVGNIRSVDILDYLRFLADVHRQIADLPDGAQVKLRVVA